MQRQSFATETGFSVGNFKTAQRAAFAQPQPRNPVFFGVAVAFCTAGLRPAPQPFVLVAQAFLPVPQSPTIAYAPSSSTPNNAAFAWSLVAPASCALSASR